MATIAQLMVNIGADVSDFKSGTNEVKSDLKSLASDVAKISAAAFAGIAAAMAPVSAYALKLSSNMQQAGISFETMLGSAEKANAMIGDLWQFAAETPFEFDDLQSATKKMLAFGFAAEDIIPDLTAVGDAAAGLGMSGQEGINRIVIALGQMKAKSKVSGDEMLQMTEAGIPAWDILAKSMKKSTAEVMALAEKGVIPADQAIQALLLGMEERFPNMMDKQSKSMQGLFSTLKDNISTVLIEVFKPAVAWLTDVGLPKLVEMTGNFSNTMKNGGSLTEAFNSMFSGGFDGVLSQMGTVGEYLQDIGDMIAWVKDNANSLIPVLIELASAFVALQIIQSVLGPLEAFVVVGIVVVGVIMSIAAAAGEMAIVTTITPIFTALIGVLSSLATASLVIAGVVLAVGALAAAAYLIYDNWEPIKAWMINFWNSIVNIVADNINIVIALFPGLGVAAYVIYEYWDDAVTLANSAMIWLAEQVAFVTNKITNNFQWYSKMWDDFVNWARQGVADFKSYLSELVDSFIPQWASSMLSGIQSLGEQLTSKTAEIGKAMKNNLTVDVQTPMVSGMADFVKSEDSNTQTVTKKAATTIKAADWSSANLSGGGADKATDKAAKAYEKLQEQAEKTSKSIKDEWISLTATQTDALDNWYSKELADLNESASANADYQNDLDRLNQIYAAKKLKIDIDQQKSTNSIWDSAISKAEEYGNRVAELGMSEGTKQIFEIDTAAAKEITEIANAARDAELAFQELNNEAKLQTIQAMTAAGTAFTVMKDGMLVDAKELAAQVNADTANMSNTVISYAQDVASKTNLVHEEAAEKKKEIDENYLNWKQKLDNAYDKGNIAAYTKLISDSQSLTNQYLAGQQEAIDAYSSAWKESNRSALTYVVEGIQGFSSSFSTFISDSLSGTEEWGDAWKALGQSVRSVIAGMIASWIEAKVVKTALDSVLGTSSTGTTTGTDTEAVVAEWGTKGAAMAAYYAAETAAQAASMTAQTAALTAASTAQTAASIASLTLLTTASIAAAAAIAAAWAPAAAAVSLATLGGNSEAAMAGMTAAYALANTLSVPGFSNGGSVSGAGTGTSDSILMWGSNGEYMMQASAVDKFGIGFFNALNNGQMPAFATGGLVTGPSLSSLHYASSGRAFKTTSSDQTSQRISTVKTEINGNIYYEAGLESVEKRIVNKIKNTLLGG